MIFAIVAAVKLIKKKSQSKHFNPMQTGSTCTLLILKLGWKRPINFNCLSIDCLLYTLHVQKPLFLKVKLEIPRNVYS